MQIYRLQADSVSKLQLPESYSSSHVWTDWGNSMW